MLASKLEAESRKLLKVPKSSVQEESYIVESLLEKRSGPKDSQHQYLVKWRDYSKDQVNQVREML